MVECWGLKRGGSVDLFLLNRRFYEAKNAMYAPRFCRSESVKAQGVESRASQDGNIRQANEGLEIFQEVGNRLRLDMNYWLSYGGGVNSTALAVLLVRGELPQFEPWRVVFADTGDEKALTYSYIQDVFVPWLRSHGKNLEVVAPKETVLQRWQRLKVTGSRIIRACSVEAKIRPMDRYVALHGGGLGKLVGIDAGEAHRAKERPGVFYPLVDLDIDREQCAAIIKSEGLPVPGKSGCWHCPFARVSEVLALVKSDPCKAAIIERLENAATESHGPNPNGGPRTHWGERSIPEWRVRAAQGDLFIPDRDPTEPCDCYDG